MYKFWYDYVKLYYSENSKLFYMDKDSFIVYLKTDDIAEDVETRFDTFDKFRNRQTLTYRENKKVIGLVKDELDGQIIKEFVRLRAKHVAI